jgi:hypothetical protein
MLEETAALIMKDGKSCNIILANQRNERSRPWKKNVEYQKAALSCSGKQVRPSGR